MISLNIFKHFVYWYIKLSLFQEEKNYTYPINRTKIDPIARFLTLLLFFFGLLSSRIGKFLKIRIYLIDWYRISPSSEGRSHHNYVDSGHGRVRI